MNKVLFCYDGPLSKDKEGNYYGSALNDGVFSKYKCLGDKVSIVIRVKKIEKEYAVNKLLKISTEFNIVEIPNIKSIKGILFERKKFKKIIRESIKDSQFVIIRMPSSAGNVAIKYCNKYNKKYIVEMVGCVWDALWNYNIKGKILAPISFISTKTAIKKASNVIYVTQKFLQQRYPNLKNNIGCSDVSLPDLDDSQLQIRLNKINNMKKHKKIIIGTCAAIDIKYKGQEYVIKSLKKLKEKGYHNFEYQLVGGGSADRLMKIAKKYDVLENIKIIGSLPHDKVFNWLDNIDIYIQPSNQEGLCRALVEAMSKGLPCIASNAGGNSELIDIEYIFKKKNVNDLTNKIIAILNDMCKEALKNFTKAKEYETEKLDKKRRKFYTMVGVR